MTGLLLRYSTLLTIGIGAAATGCATPGPRPQDMGVAAHETAAASAEPGAAARHRAAARNLRDAQGLACAGVAEGERELAPFFQRADVEGFEPLFDHVGRGGRVLRGSVISVRPAPGVTAEWLERSIECHVRRAAALGSPAREMGSCPLAVKGVDVTVRSGGERFIVEIRSRDLTAANDVWRRTQSLGSIAGS